MRLLYVAYRGGGCPGRGVMVFALLVPLVVFTRGVVRAYDHEQVCPGERRERGAVAANARTRRSQRDWSRARRDYRLPLDALHGRPHAGQRVRRSSLLSCTAATHTRSELHTARVRLICIQRPADRAGVAGGSA